MDLGTLVLGTRTEALATFVLNGLGNRQLRDHVLMVLIRRDKVSKQNARVTIFRLGTITPASGTGTRSQLRTSYVSFTLSSSWPYRVVRASLCGHAPN